MNPEADQPLTVASLKPEPVEAQAAPPAAPTPAGKDPLVIVIDDDPDFLNVMVRELKRLNEEVKFEVASAPSGDHGVALARPSLIEKRPLFVMTDYRMPGLTGTQVVQTIRREHPDSPVRFLVYSGYDTPDSALPLKELHPSEFMTKPIDLRDLRSDLRRLVGSWLARLEAQTMPPRIA